MRKFKEEDFMSELEAASRLRPSRTALVLLFTIISLVVAFMIWASLAKVEEITRGQGQVVPSQDIQIVQSLEGGIVEEILVRQGELVKKGDVLLRISDVMYTSQERGTEAQFLSLTAKKARLSAEARGEEYVVPEEIAQKVPQIAANETALYESVHTMYIPWRMHFSV